jgi:hypothetical protein
VSEVHLTKAPCPIEVMLVEGNLIFPTARQPTHDKFWSGLFFTYLY